MGLICDVFDVNLYTDTGEMIASTTLQSADMKISVDEKEIRAGKGDALVAILHSARKVDISLAEIEFKWDWIANQLGQTATTAAVDVWAVPKFYTAVSDTGIKITLDETPKNDETDIRIYTSAGVLIANTTYSIEGKVVTFASGVEEGQIVEVRGYIYTSAATASTVLIDNTSFADGLKCILTTIEIDSDETPIYTIQVQLDECLPSGNFELNTKSARDASVSNFTFKAIKPRTSDNLGRIIRIPISA
ncbi:MAG: hypothetical protein M0R51_09050 [Clostridia bacterium]|jgi:hypothetical protein|nr:hypothetical protein [Clostridia bacterium]